MFLSFRTISVRTIIAERFLRGIVSVECSKSFSINTTHAMAYSSSSFSNSGDGESDSNSNDSAHNSTEYDHRYGGLDENQFRHLFGDSSNLIKDFYQPQLRELKKGSLKVLLPFKEIFVGNRMIPCLHGGIVASLIDHVGGFTCWSSLYTPFQRVSTVDLRVDYLRPAPCEDLWFEAQVLHATKKYIRSDVVCWNADRSKKLAIGRCLFNIYEGKEDLSKLIKVEKN